MGISFNHCLVVPDYLGSGEVCAAVRDNPVTLGTRDCFFRESPEMYSVDATLLSEDIAGYSFEFGFWAGIEVDENTGGVCLWIGNEDYQICEKVCTDSLQDEEAIYNLAKDFNDAMVEKTGHNAFEVLGAIIVLVLVAFLIAVFELIAGAAGFGPGV